MTQLINEFIDSETFLGRDPEIVAREYRRAAAEVYSGRRDTLIALLVPAVNALCVGGIPNTDAKIVVCGTVSAAMMVGVRMFYTRLKASVCEDTDAVILRQYRDNLTRNKPKIFGFHL